MAFGNITSTIYAAGRDGTIYEIDPDSLSASVVLKNNFYPNSPLGGLTVKTGGLINPPDELNSSSESDELDDVFYTIKNISFSEGFLLAQKATGEIIGRHIFSALSPFIALSSWPSDDNLFIAITSNEFYFLEVGSTIKTTIVPSPVLLDEGVSFIESESNDVAVFGVPSGSYPRKINTFTLNRNSKAVVFKEAICYAENDSGPCLLQNVSGLAYETSANPVTSHVAEDGSNFIVTYSGGIRVVSDNIPVSIADISFLLGGKHSYLEPTAEDEIIINVEEYDPYSGNPIGNIDELSFGDLKPGKISNHRVVKLSFDNINSVFGIQTGISNFIMGESDASCVEYYISSNPDDMGTWIPFSGVNEDENPDSEHNVSIGNISTTSSKYLHIRIVTPDNFLGQARISFRWFFEYDDDNSNTVIAASVLVPDDSSSSQSPDYSESTQSQESSDSSPDLSEQSESSPSSVSTISEISPDFSESSLSSNPPPAAIMVSGSDNPDINGSYTRNDSGYYNKDGGYEMEAPASPSSDINNFTGWFTYFLFSSGVNTWTFTRFNDGNQPWCSTCAYSFSGTIPIQWFWAYHKDTTGEDITGTYTQTGYGGNESPSDVPNLPINPYPADSFTVTEIT